MNKKLSYGTMLAVAAGELFGGGAFNVVNFLYPGFLALAVGLPAHLAGIVILIARIIDAVIDPPIGYFSDKLRVRFGTRRKTLLVSAPLIVLALFLMFYPYSNPGIGTRFFLALISYVFFVIVQSSVMIPYYSLSSEISEDYTERARLTSLRMGFSIFSSIVCVALPGVIVSHFEGNTGYIVMSLTFGVAFMICVGITGLFTKEGIPAPEKAESFKLRDFIQPLQIRTFRQYLCIFLCCQVTMAVMSALFFFYVDFYFCRDLTAQGEGNMVGLLGAAIMFGMQIVALPFYLAMIKKAGKIAAYILGSAIWIVGALFLFVLPANSGSVPLYILAAVLGFGISGPGLIPHAIFADVVDVGDLRFGKRAAGIFGGVANLTIQIGQAVGVAAVMAGIGLAGFVEQDISEGAEKITSQSLSAQNAIVYIMALAPLLLMSIAVIVCTRYRLNKEMHNRVLIALEGSEEEKAAVLKLL
ncbi:MAG: MFS transporter [Oscillospiraceae bacterium]|nr:MFS transporter [Oscillospiraceae bacterium]